MNDLNPLQLLIASYLYKQLNPGATDAEVAEAITADLKKWKAYLVTLDKKDIES